MRKSVGLGIVILVGLLIISPVAACHVVISSTSDKEVCTTCDFYTTVITVKSVAGGVGDTNYLVSVKDILPAGIDYVSYTDNGPVPETASCASPASPVLDSSCRVIQWNYNNVPHNAQWTITLNVRPNGKTDEDTATNVVEARLKHISSNTLGGLVSSSSTTAFENDLCPIPSPEFPTLALPVGLIIGMLGVVLFLQRSKEN